MCFLSVPVITEILFQADVFFQKHEVNTDLRGLSQSFPCNRVKGFIKVFPIVLDHDGVILELNLERKAVTLALPQPCRIAGLYQAQECEVRSVMLTRVNGRIADNIPKDPLDCRSQTCSLQAHSTASSQGLAQVSANHSKGQRSALTYGLLGKQRHKGFTWQKHHSQKTIQRHQDMALQQSFPKHSIIPDSYPTAFPACQVCFSLKNLTI